MKERISTIYLGIVNQETNWKNIKLRPLYWKRNDTFSNIASTSTSVTLSDTVLELIVLPLSTGVACGFKLSHKVLYEGFRSKYVTYTICFGGTQGTTNSLDKLYRNCVQDILIHIKNTILCLILLKDILAMPSVRRGHM